MSPFASTLAVALAVIFMMVSGVHAAAYLRLLNAIPSGASVVSVSFFLDGQRMNIGPVYFGSYASSQDLVYYETTPGDHNLLVVSYRDTTTVYYNATITGLVDGVYYSTLVGGWADPWTVQDDVGTNIPAGFARVRFLNSWTQTGNNTMLLRINGQNNATFRSLEIANGGYFLLDNTVSYNFTVGQEGSVVYFFDKRNQDLGNFAYTFWLIGPISSGGVYNSSGLSAYEQGRLIDGAAAPVKSSTTTPAVTTTQAGTTPSSTTTPSVSTTQPSGSSSGQQLIASVGIVVLTVTAVALSFV